MDAELVVIDRRGNEDSIVLPFLSELPSFGVPLHECEEIFGLRRLDGENLDLGAGLLFQFLQPAGEVVDLAWSKEARLVVNVLPRVLDGLLCEREVRAGEKQEHEDVCFGLWQRAGARQKAEVRARTTRHR